jgi:hypothetical protein
MAYIYTRMIIEHLHENIYKVKDFMSMKMCQELVEYIDKNAIHDVKLTKNANVRCHFIPAHMTPYMDTVKDVFTEIARKFFIMYRVKTMRCSDVSMRKIHGATKMHVDGMYDDQLLEGDKICTINLRKLTVIVALNGDYEGGNLIFPKQNFKLKLKAGEAVIFPPYWTHIHLTEPPTNNTFRYTLNGWLCGADYDGHG